MVQPSPETLNLVKQLREELTSNNLPPKLAKLYSQHSRLQRGQPGLTGWREEEATVCLKDAMRLFEVAFIEQEANSENWQAEMRRAAEILEWLSHPQLNPHQLPLRLLAAAAYHLAGYPARSAGLLREGVTEPESKILHAFLTTDFPSLLKLLTEYWALPPESEESSWEEKLHQQIVKEVASSLGVLCAAMRWGEESRMEKALDKLTTVGKIFLHSTDTYSWLLAKLCAAVAKIYTQNSMRTILPTLFGKLSEEGKEGFERYIRLSYLEKKMLVWPSQQKGIERLVQGGSFALCTPTGSGKTMVAELAILQNLFLNQPNTPAPLALYLVPSRALATEVENKLCRVLQRIHRPSIQVTGLYGGLDWGPTDAWLTEEKPTVLICTYEKAEALIRFLGTNFLPRISLIVLDEAHSIQFDEGKISELQNFENRSLRLEVLGMRLLTHLEQTEPKGRMIALSAVAGGIENTIASWITGDPNALATNTPYRSTRQLIGRLECLPDCKFQIHYDLLDNTELKLGGSGRQDSPFIPNPFPPYPPTKWNKEGVETRLRPYLFWAAMHLAASDDRGQQRAVLISVTQNISGYSEDFLKLLGEWESYFSDIFAGNLPKFFNLPSNQEKRELWDKCLKICEDYYGEESCEYRLLNKGVIVYHGNMPGLMKKFLTKVIEERIVHIVLATSTLSEGVNLPFETVLIPTLRRGKKHIGIREFGNLVGRAGRPGCGTEGQGLILLSELKATNTKDAQSIKRSRHSYFSLIQKMKNRPSTKEETITANSPLARLLEIIHEQWQTISGLTNDNDFMKWLEETAPLEVNQKNLAVESLDSLDAVLLSCIVEIEQITGQELTASELEDHLRKLWQRSYAYYASRQEKRLEEIFVQRGQSLKTRIYPESSQRQKLYRTSLPPRSGSELLKRHADILQLLEAGREYAVSPEKEKFEYICKIAETIKDLPKFGFNTEKSKVSWREILQWWLCPTGAKWPSEKDISKWHKYVSENFIYRLNWGLGSVIALTMEPANEKTSEDDFPIFSFDDWSRLPWIVFWLKELIFWGTLEPMAAYLLAHSMAVTRAEASKMAQGYYTEQIRSQLPNEQLNPVRIRKWALQQHKGNISATSPDQFSPVQIRLLRDFSKTTKRDWRVVPVMTDNEVHWFDLAGFPLAVSPKLENWEARYLEIWDFKLNVIDKVVSAENFV